MTLQFQGQIYDICFHFAGMDMRKTDMVGVNSTGHKRSTTERFIWSKIAPTQSWFCVTSRKLHKGITISSTPKLNF